MSITHAVPEDDVAKRLRALQDHYGLTSQDMADRCGLPKRSLENYMRAKKPQRPGLDALRSIADGLDVSVDWLIGRADGAFAPEFKTEDFALFCHSVVLRLLGELIPLAAAEPEAFDPVGMSINGVDHADIAAAVMLDFMQGVRTQRGNSSRPKGCFKDHFTSISTRPERSGLPASCHEILRRNPLTNWFTSWAKLPTITLKKSFSFNTGVQANGGIFAVFGLKLSKPL